MQVMINYILVLLYYTIGAIVSLKYLTLYAIQKVKGNKDVSSDDDQSEVPKCLQDVKVESKEADLKVNGKEVHIKYVTKGSSKNPLMLFLSGFPEFWYIWKHQMTEFSQEYWTLALEITGGEQDKGLRRPFLVDCIKATLDHLDKNRCILLGRDVGGSLIWSFLDKYPELVVKAIIINAPHPEALKKEMKRMSQLVKASSKLFYLLPKLPEWTFQRNNFHKIDTLLKSAEASPEDINSFKNYLKRNNSEALKNGLNFYRTNFIADNIFRTHSKVSQSETYPQVLVVFTKPNLFYSEKCFIHNYVKESIQCTEIQTKHGHFFQLNEKSSKLLNKIIKNYFENPNKWETEWNDDKVTSGIIMKENFDEEDEKENKETEEVFDKLIKQCNETIENIKEDIKEITEKKNE